METKRCSTCGLHKLPDEYHRSRQRKDGLNNNCKQCCKERDEKRRHRLPFELPCNNARHRASKAGVPFDIDQEYLEDIWTGFCPVFGTKMSLPGRGSEWNTKAVPSLDRIRPEAGYVKGNVIWISMYANVIKSHATHQEIHRVADWLEEIEKEIQAHETR